METFGKRIDAHDDLKDRYVIVEIGGGDKPLMNDLRLSEDKNALYLGIDHTPLHRVPSRQAPTTAMLIEDVTSSSFLESSYLDGKVDRLVVFNVISILGDKDFITENIPKFIDKISKSLKPGGKALIGEWYTPEWAQELIHIDYARYNLKCRILERPEEVHEILSEFGVIEKRIQDIVFRWDQPEVSDAGGKPFMLVLTHPEQEGN